MLLVFITIVPLTEFNECIVYLSSHSTLSDCPPFQELQPGCSVCVHLAYYTVSSSVSLSCHPSSSILYACSRKRTQTHTHLYSLKHTQHINNAYFLVPYIYMLSVAMFTFTCTTCYFPHFSWPILVANGSHSILFWSVFIVPQEDQFRHENGNLAS